MLRRAACRLRPQSQAAKGSLSALQDPGHTWRACSSPASFSGLQEGHWLLTLRATDAAGLTRQSRRVLPCQAMQLQRCQPHFAACIPVSPGAEVPLCQVFSACSCVQACIISKVVQRACL